MKSAERKIEDLQRILDVTRQMAVTTDLAILLGMTIEAACEVLACERATVFLYDPKTDELYSRVATGVDAIRIPADSGIAGTAAKERVVVNVPDAYSDPRFNPDVDRATGFRTRNLLTFPLENLQGELIGVLQALNKTGGPFGPDDEELARVLSAQAGVALDRWRLLEEFAQKQRMERDLQIAREIQLALFPKSNPKVDGYEVAGWNRSADETGGDCYDFIRLKDGRVAVVLADATGHGIGSALVIAECRSLVRAMLTVTQDLQRIAICVNDLLEEDLSDDRFVTAFVGILDPARNVVEYAACGQGPLLLVAPEGVTVRPAGDLPLAVVSHHGYAEPSSFELSPGSTLVLLTDGFYETANPAGELFGEQRVTEIVRRHGEAPLGALIEQLHQAVSQFRGEDPQADDLTAVLIRRKRDTS